VRWRCCRGECVERRVGVVFGDLSLVGGVGGGFWLLASQDVRVGVRRLEVLMSQGALGPFLLRILCLFCYIE